MPLNFSSLTRAGARTFWLGAALCSGLALTPLARAADVLVTNTADSGAGSLRAAVQAAASGDVLRFSSAGPITLTSVIDINKNLTIDGLVGGAWVPISGGSTSSLFRVDVGFSATLTHLSLRNAVNAVQNNGNLTVNRVAFSGNSGSMGAALTGCVSPDAQLLTVIDSVFTQNAAQNGGGAIAACGQINISGSTFSGNTASYGGALAVTNTGAVRIVNSTFQGNAATGAGGAITTDYLGLALTNVTFSGNQSGAPGSALMPNGSVAVSVVNTVFAHGSGGAHCGNPVQGANNLNFGDPSGGNSCGASVSVTADPQLAALADNGGPTPTMALAAGSPAIDAGRSSGAPATDQRGTARPQGGGMDIGAYEFKGASVVVANGEAFNVSSAGGSTASVIANDTVDAQAAVLGTNASLTPGVAPVPAGGGIAMDGSGVITVAAHTTPGSYTYPYQVCALPAGEAPVCASATATVTVQAPAPVEGGVTAVPSLSEWALLALAGLLGLAAAARPRRVSASTEMFNHPGVRRLGRGWACTAPSPGSKDTLS